jgi:UDP-N-acetylglucosamine--N-acetylmuramyl-(pentapeptide) pyrophosphoryl-undecaprenol N-acetylglucosamine transferase
MKKTIDKLPRIALVGGLTAGPIIPLLAVAEAIREANPRAKFLIIDVKNSVGQHMAKLVKYPFARLITGKLNRYFSWRNILTPILLAIGFFQALWVLRSQQVTYIVGAGGFVQVPVIWAGWLLRIPAHIHQQDVNVTLANVLAAPIAKSISVTFESSLRDFFQGSGLFRPAAHKNKITHTGNPVRQAILRASVAEAHKYFGLDPAWPTLYVVGGGSGALGLNRLVAGALPELLRTVQVIHSTGRGKAVPVDTVGHKRYHAFEFVNRAELALAAADIVLTRSGISTLTELANLGKASIIIPLPNTHQEQTALMLFRQKAAIVLDESETSPSDLVNIIQRLLFDLPGQQALQKNIGTIMPHGSAEKIAKIIL